MKSIKQKSISNQNWKHTWKCSMCDKNLINFENFEESLMPRMCIEKHGLSAHRVCQKCWFEKFAIENQSHECPGCVKKKSLTKSDDRIIVIE